MESIMNYPDVVNKFHVEALAVWEKNHNAPNSKPVYNARFFPPPNNRGYDTTTSSKLNLIGKYSVKVSGRMENAGDMSFRGEVYTMEVESNGDQTGYIPINTFTDTDLGDLVVSIYKCIASDMNICNSEQEAKINL